GQPAGERWAGLAGADDDRVEATGHRITMTMANAAAIATASSMKAAGGSLPNVAASFARAARPPRVPITAPTIPATAPRTSDPADAPIAPPESAPVTIREQNCTGTVRGGVACSRAVRRLKR